jgi:galactokinase
MTKEVPAKQQLFLLYGADPATLARQERRWQGLAEEYRRRFDKADLRHFSAPGRTEIGGNHTDHNHGKVLAAAINLDSIAVAAPTSERRITVYSEGYDAPFVVGLEALSLVPTERGTTAALVRGIAARFLQLGHAIGGLQACIASDVPVGSGLSSSASIEVLLGTVLNALYNEARVGAQEIAIIGQHAENVYFGKPCGLMDQVASAVGGIVKIDFAEPESPCVEKVDFDFAAAGYHLLVVNTGGSHADLAEDYAAIPREMRRVAAQFGREVCRQLSEPELVGRVAELRSGAGDRAILRALHFLQENHRVDLQVQALKNRDMREFLRLVGESGNSSFRWLQNCISGHAVAEQGIPLALALTEGFIGKGEGACRVHGGGFAGTILTFLPAVRIDEYRAFMESVFGSGCVKILRVRSQGCCEVG